MKSIIATFFLMMCLQMPTAFGQIEKGTKMVGGSGFGRFFTESGDLYVYLVANYGIFVSNKICLGGELISLNDFYSNSTSGYLGIAPFIRYCFNVKEKRYFFTKFSPGIGMNYSSSDNEEISGMADVSLGHDWFLIPSVTFEASIFGNLIFAEEAEGSVGLRFGFQIYLKKNKELEPPSIHQ